MRLVFFGTPVFSAEFLKRLISEADIQVIAIVTQPDEPKGRKHVLTPPPTKVVAEEHAIPVWQPSKLKTPEFLEALRRYEADLFVVIAYGRILPQALLDIPRLGCVNVHPSLLPKWRGPTPMQAAIANGDKETGVTIMLLDAAMDHGPILAQEVIELSPEETTETLTQKVVLQGAPLLIETLEKYLTSEITPQEQNNDLATVCHLLAKADGRINWQEPAVTIEAKIRAYTPWPGATTTWQRNNEPHELKIHKARVSETVLPIAKVTVIDKRLFVGTGQGSLEIIELQPAAGKRMPVSAFLAGYGDIVDSRLS